MKNHFKLILSAIFGIFCISTTHTANAGPYEDGVTAFHAGKYEQALPLFTKASEDDNPKAQFYIGNMYQYGHGIPQSYKQASIWYEKAIANDQGPSKVGPGVVYAQHNLGIMLLKGKGIPKSEARAFELFQKAANSGYAAAQFNFGLMHAKGTHVTYSPNTAMEWFQKSADQGHEYGMHSLAIGYYYGTGVKQSTATAIIWYKKAAALGNKEAQNMLTELGAN